MNLAEEYRRTPVGRGGQLPKSRRQERAYEVRARNLHIRRGLLDDDRREAGTMGPRVRPGRVRGGRGFRRLAPNSAGGRC
jgi:hypothetical protein